MTDAMDNWGAKTQLQKRIQEEIGANGVGCSLNHLDVSAVDDMSELFQYSPFNGDISRWNVSHVVRMDNMFHGNTFNGDISDWNVSNVKSMRSMFKTSFFKGDLSRWDVSNVVDMSSMFMMAVFNGDISRWRVGNVREMYNMFEGAAFNGDLSQWDMRAVEDVQSMFMHSSFNGNVSGWRLNAETVLTNLFKHCPFQGDFPQGASFHRVASGALSADYRGRFNNQYTLYEVERFFGGVQPLNDYLRETAASPLDRLHFEKLAGLKSRPAWIAKDVFKWVKSQQPVLSGLGMAEDEMGLWMQKNFNAGTKDVPVYPLDELVLDTGSMPG